MSSPLLKRFGDLSLSDLQTHRVWVSCHVMDYDEPWYEGTDEETFRPWDRALPVEPVDGMFLVLADATFSDGTRGPAFLTPAVRANDLGTMQPHVFVDDRPFGFWGGVIGVPEEDRQRLLNTLGKGHGDVFPIRFVARSDLTNGERSVVVTDWL
ncbi:MAG: hypothetical protein GY720_13285 [bacterium]|nr:hypothetical protein [bacterium]